MRPMFSLPVLVPVAKVGDDQSSKICNRRSSSFYGPKARDIPERRTQHELTFQVQAEALVADSRAEGTKAEQSSDVPLLLRAMRKEALERPPVWMMRQAGRYMKEYRDLCERYTFRERSENADIATQISLQPWKAYQPDGVILFSDILTPLAGMGIDFEIVRGRGPVITEPIRTAQQIADVRPLDPATSLHFVGQTLRNLRDEVGNRSTVLGFVGAPWTLAAYAIEGGSSDSLRYSKGMAFSEPAMFRQLLDKITDSIAEYVCYQIENGAQAVQLFDSWGGLLGPHDFAELSLPYMTRIVQHVRAKHPLTPLLVFANAGGGILEQLAQTGADAVSVDWRVDMADARRRLGDDMVLQGNVDPSALFGSREFIRARVADTIEKAGKRGHIMNLGHGIIKNTPFDSVLEFVDATRSYSPQ